ncbi:MAG TPA: GNAT family N-acetyltransferase [Christensenellaceae bacterium]|nr:GNAT family N-acetyltransferase [Christensenellaceae bacterium]
MNIRTFEKRDLQSMNRIWNESVQTGKVIYYYLTEAYFHTKFEKNPHYNPKYSLVAGVDDEIVGFINGIVKKIFLTNKTNENSPGDITCFFVHKDYRYRGIGRVLVDELCKLFKSAGKRSDVISNNNPVNFDWRVPGTYGHDHNNTPGVDMDSQGYEFLKAIDFEDSDRKIAMYLYLKNYIPWDKLKEQQAQLLSEDIFWKEKLSLHYLLARTTAPRASICAQAFA